MNEHDEQHGWGPDEEQAIDRLVDGELDESARRELLASLEYAEGGWRNLALAFVEDQVLREDFADIRTEADPPRPVTKDERSATGETFGSWRMMLAVAASLLVAFGLGMWIRGTGSEDPGAGDMAAVPPQAGEGATVPQPSPLPPTQFASHQGEGSPVVANPPQSMIELPVYPASRNVDPWQVSSGPTIPPDVVDALERMGHRLDRRRSLIPVQLENGRRLVVPVEDIEVQFVGGQGYQ